MSKRFPNLIEEFTAAVTATAKQEALPIPVLVAHYKTAMRHGTADVDEKRSLAEIMFRLTHHLLEAYASPSHAPTLVTIKVKEKMAPMLETLCAPESIDFLPRDAGIKLAAIVMRVSDTAAKTTYEHLKKWNDLETYHAQAAALAELALQYADIINAPRPAASVETSKDIAPAKRITLKPAEGTQP